MANTIKDSVKREKHTMETLGAKTLKPACVIVCVILSILVLSTQTSHASLATINGPTIPEPVTLLKGGRAVAVAVRENYAYVGAKNIFRVVDITEPANMKTVNELSLPADVVEIVLGDFYGYVFDNAAKLQVLDISSPGYPSLMGEIILPGAAQYATLAGNHIYAGDLTHLWVVDISDPSQPELVDQIALNWMSTSIAVLDGYAYLTHYELCTSSNLQIFSLSDPAHPVDAGSIPLAGCATDIAVAGETIYVAEYLGVDPHIKPGRIEVFDVAIPGQPVAISQVEFPWGVEQLAISGDSAYAVAYGYNIYALDIRDPHSPVLGSSFEFNVEDIAAYGDYVFIAGNPGRGRSDGPGGLGVGYGESPASFRLATFYPTQIKPNDATRVGNHIYISENTFGMRVIDISESTRIHEDGFLLSLGHFVLSTVASENYLYSSMAYSGLWITDISEPSAPKWVGQYRPAWFPGGNVLVKEPYAYLVENGSSLMVIDVTNPYTPTEVNKLDLNIQYMELLSPTIARPDWYALSVLGGYSLHVWSLDNPIIPSDVSVFTTTNSIIGIYTMENWVLVETWNGANGNGEILILDVQNPALPVQLGQLAIDYPCGLSTQDHLIYLSCDDLHILDISNPVSPHEVGTYMPNSPAFFTIPDGKYLYLLERGTIAYDTYDGQMEIVWFVPSVSASIEPMGGNLVSEIDGTSYAFTNGTFTESVTVTHVSRYPGAFESLSGLVGTDHFFENTAIDANGQTVEPGLPYTITIHYAEKERGVAVETSLALYFWDGIKWVRDETSQVDGITNTITAHPSRFGLWAVLGETHRQYLPITRR